MKLSCLAGLLTLSAVAAKKKSGNNEPAEDWHAPGKNGCDCSANCIVWGDPHVINVFGDTWLDVGPKSTYFDGMGVKITGTTNKYSPHHFLESVTWKAGKTTQTVEETSCDQNGNLPADETNFSYEEGDTKVTLELTCRQVQSGQQGKLGDAYHLMADIMIYTGTEAITDVAAKGLCMHRVDQTDEERDEELAATDVYTPPWVKPEAPKCACTGSCTMMGDPHINTFIAREALLKNEATGVSAAGEVVVTYDNIDTYTSSDNKFKMSSTFTEQYWYIDDLTVQGKKYTKADCPKNIRGEDKVAKIGDFDVNVKDGRIWGVVVCGEETQGARTGKRYLGVSMRKTITTAGESFETMELASGSTGACTAAPAAIIASSPKTAQIVKGTYIPSKVIGGNPGVDTLVAKGKTTNTLVQISQNLRQGIMNKLATAN